MAINYSRVEKSEWNVSSSIISSRCGKSNCDYSNLFFEPSWRAFRLRNNGEPAVRQNGRFFKPLFTTNVSRSVGSQAVLNQCGSVLNECEPKPRLILNQCGLETGLVLNPRRFRSQFTTHSRPDEDVRAWFTTQPAASLYLSVITIGELRRGFALLPAGKRRTDLEQWFERSLTPAFQGRILPVTQTIAERWGVMDAAAKARGIAVKIADGLIAATAIEHGLTLATRNVRDFVQLPVKLHNPWPKIGSS